MGFYLIQLLCEPPKDPKELKANKREEKGRHNPWYSPVKVYCQWGVIYLILFSKFVK